MWPITSVPGTGISTPSYHLLHVVAWFAFYFAGITLTRSRPDLRHHWLWLAIGWGFCDFIGARLAYRMIYGWHSAGFTAAPLLAAIFTMIYVGVRRLRASPLLDAWAVAFSMASILEKSACLAAGCCFGRTTSSPWGMTLRESLGNPSRVHPLPLYEMGLHLLTALGLGWLYAHGRAQGRIVFILGLVFGAWRGAAEAARGGGPASFLNSPFSLTQIVCLIAVGFSLAYLLTDLWRDFASASRP